MYLKIQKKEKEREIAFVLTSHSMYIKLIILFLFIYFIKFTYAKITMAFKILGTIMITLDENMFFDRNHKHMYRKIHRKLIQHAKFET